MWNEEKEKQLKEVIERRDELHRSWYFYGRGNLDADICPHTEGNYWRKNTLTGEVLAVIPSLGPRDGESDELWGLLRLAENLLFEKTSGPEWEQYDPYK